MHQRHMQIHRVTNLQINWKDIKNGIQIFRSRLNGKEDHDGFLQLIKRLCATLMMQTQKSTTCNFMI